MPKIEVGEEEYRIVGDDGTEGANAFFGETAVLDTETCHYTALVDIPKDGGEPVSLMEGGWIFDVMGGKMLKEVDLEDVSFEEEEGEEGDDDDDAVSDDEDDDEDGEEIEIEELKTEE
jgi:hypothetical protein